MTSNAFSIKTNANNISSKHKSQSETEQKYDKQYCRSAYECLCVFYLKALWILSECSFTNYLHNNAFSVVDGTQCMAWSKKAKDATDAAAVFTVNAVDWINKVTGKHSVLWSNAEFDMKTTNPK